jgi:DNA-binding transcriptional MerR regulator
MTMSEPEDRLLTPSEVAAIFAVLPRTVTRWAEDGHLHTTRTPAGHRRYDANEVFRMLEAGTEERE